MSFVVVLGALATIGGPVAAALLDVMPGFPRLTFNNGGTTSYDATTGDLSVSATPIAIRFIDGGPVEFIDPATGSGTRSLTIDIVLDGSGGLVASAGPHLVIEGAVGAFDGVLLTADATGFGFFDTGVGGPSDLYDFRFTATGGLLTTGATPPVDPASEFVVAMSSEDSTFAGDFTVDFEGGAKGNGGPPRCLCVVVIDEDTIDNNISSIEAAAADHSTPRDIITSEFLVNDDIPTLGPNPCLRWNDMFPGDIVLLPGGQVNDEGIFALPEDLPASWGANPLEDFVAGVLPQSVLAEIPDVMPLRSQDLFRLIGRTCVAVVYDSDISINFKPLLANLQGERYGLFYFKVLGVVVPGPGLVDLVEGPLPESQSSSSLYMLRVRVEPCMDGACLAPLPVQIRQHPPDSIAINRATYSNGALTLFGVSGFIPQPVFMTTSVENLFLEKPMTFVGGDEYGLTFSTPVDLVDRRIMIATDTGGQDNLLISAGTQMGAERSPPGKGDGLPN